MSIQYTDETAVEILRFASKPRSFSHLPQRNEEACRCPTAVHSPSTKVISVTIRTTATGKASYAELERQSARRQVRANDFLYAAVRGVHCSAAQRICLSVFLFFAER